MSRLSGTRLGSLRSVNPELAQAPSHTGLIAEAPQRHSASWGVAWISCPSQSRTCSALVTRYGPLWAQRIPCGRPACISRNVASITSRRSGAHTSLPGLGASPSPPSAGSPARDGHASAPVHSSHSERVSRAGRRTRPRPATPNRSLPPVLSAGVAVCRSPPRRAGRSTPSTSRPAVSSSPARWTTSSTQSNRPTSRLAPAPAPSADETARASDAARLDTRPPARLAGSAGERGALAANLLVAPHSGKRAASESATSVSACCTASSSAATGADGISSISPQKLAASRTRSSSSAHAASRCGIR